MPTADEGQAGVLMEGFAQRTGLGADGPQRRYLWTDAFAVCNFLGLAQAAGDRRPAELALQLIADVHRTLGRHRPDDRRKGWISGLPESEGALHPTRGGLRIGKERPERSPGEREDEREEWDRDGQYFHYLTKWMHALDQAARALAQPTLNLWARELAATAQRAFTYRTADGVSRMVWKMSIDLTRPLVASMGQHDALDGYVTCVQLGIAAAGRHDGPRLDEEARRFASMAAASEWATTDPLGIGSLLCDAFRVVQLSQRGAIPDRNLLETLLASAFAGLKHYARSGELEMPPERRLAFRELGLAIGLHAVDFMRESAWSQQAAFSADARALLRSLLEYLPIASAVEEFWLDARHRVTRTWSDHRDINEVMLATSLLPRGFLVLFPGG